MKGLFDSTTNRKRCGERTNQDFRSAPLHSTRFGVLGEERVFFGRCRLANTNHPLEWKKEQDAINLASVVAKLTAVVINFSSQQLLTFPNLIISIGPFLTGSRTHESNTFERKKSIICLTVSCKFHDTKVKTNPEILSHQQ
jgi:hypothetical protein